MSQQSEPTNAPYPTPHPKSNGSSTFRWDAWIEWLDANRATVKMKQVSPDSLRPKRVEDESLEPVGAHISLQYSPLPPQQPTHDQQGALKRTGVPPCGKKSLREIFENAVNNLDQPEVKTAYVDCPKDLRAQSRQRDLEGSNERNEEGRDEAKSLAEAPKQMEDTPVEPHKAEPDNNVAAPTTTTVPEPADLFHLIQGFKNALNEARQGPEMVKTNKERKPSTFTWWTGEGRKKLPRHPLNIDVAALATMTVQKLADIHDEMVAEALKTANELLPGLKKTYSEYMYAAAAEATYDPLSYAIVVNRMTREVNRMTRDWDQFEADFIDAAREGWHKEALVQSAERVEKIWRYYTRLSAEAAKLLEERRQESMARKEKEEKKKAEAEEEWKMKERRQETMARKEKEEKKADAEEGWKKWERESPRGKAEAKAEAEAEAKRMQEKMRVIKELRKKLAKGRQRKKKEDEKKRLREEENKEKDETKRAETEQNKEDEKEKPGEQDRQFKDAAAIPKGGDNLAINKGVGTMRSTAEAAAAVIEELRLDKTVRNLDSTEVANKPTRPDNEAAGEDSAEVDDIPKSLQREDSSQDSTEAANDDSDDLFMVEYDSSHKDSLDDESETRFDDGKVAHQKFTAWSLWGKLW
ncbi:hypothetical protein QBC34DRAFT_409956 [Podospora aff. communis PSN243]|uniref:Uncharacterized protein n=1 Tax=Podospora aff. communis PSN243 TaxID=3040156 RepID=A0AAV9GHI5_9PEZI|nr:hypothetical protein QBC34DRAFT_409956 [Podospora aff. communis PSN243]